MTLLRAETTAASVATTTYGFGPATALACRECGTRTPLGAHYACLECFGPLEVVYDTPTLTREAIAAGPLSIWRYKDLLPVPADVASKPGLQPGWTKLVKADNLARELGIRSLWVKDDSGNPTHSFKDRVVAIALSAARQLGFTTIG
jgi:threonine synthase